jgi:hypothetical protein
MRIGSLKGEKKGESDRRAKRASGNASVDERFIDASAGN